MPVVFAHRQGVFAPSSLAPVITASADLGVVRLIRGAMAANADAGRAHPLGPAPTLQRPLPHVTPAVRFQPRRVVEPEPRFLPRPVVRPEPRVLPAPVIDPPAEQRRKLPEANGPLPAPWQVLLREKVWNRPIISPPPGLSLKKTAPTAEVTGTGRLLDQFL